MQTAIAPSSSSGPSAPGPSQARCGPAGARGDLSDRDGRDAFASFMLEEPSEAGVADAGALVEQEAPPVAAFWPAEALRLAASGASGEASGRLLAGDQPGRGDPQTVADASALATLMGDVAAGPLTAAATGDADAAMAAPSLAANPGPAPGALAGATSVASPALALSEPAPQSLSVSAPAGTATDNLSSVPGDLAHQPAPQPGATMAASALRFWQAVPLPAADGASPSDPHGDVDVAVALAAPEDADGLAQLTTGAAPSPLTPAMLPPGSLVAKLAETALQSLFAAQAEAAARGPGEGEGFGAPSAAMTAATAFAPTTAAPATALPHLAGQLVQTLSQRPDGTTEIALSPDELGHVRVTLQADAQNPDRIIVMLNFERPETLDLFRRHADQLADALRDAGFAGADIGFGRSDGEGNRDSRPEMPLPDALAGDTGPADLAAGASVHQPQLRLAATSTLDLRL